MSNKNQLVQIWIDLPGKDMQETLQATPISESLYQIREIPFITNDVNYMDIVHCKDDGDTPRLITEVTESSGYSTLHIMFAENTPKNKVRECISVFREAGATYRRSGLRAFSICIPPKANLLSVREYVEQLRSSGILVDESRNGIGAADQASRTLGYLIGKRPKLQDGSVPDSELDMNETV